jgi:hypothetical protein
MLKKVSICFLKKIKRSGVAKFASYVSMFGPFMAPHAWDLIFKKILIA